MKKHLNTLYITSEGTWLALDGESISIKLHGEQLMRVPLHNLEAIQCFGWDIAASPQLMAKCAHDGITLSFCTPHGKLLCRVSGFTHGNVLLRRQQYRVADAPELSLPIARNIVAAKITNARTNLQRAVRDKNELSSTLQHTILALPHCVAEAQRAENAEQLLGIEGRAADLYFQALTALISNADFTFTGRNRRPPKDPVNALLSFCYTLLAHDCRSALESVGLDAAVGFYHKDRPGRASLALDLMEELRAPLADRLALTLINRRQLKAKDFVTDQSGGVSMNDDIRRLVLTSWHERKQEEIVHPFIEQKITLGLLPHIQARLLAQHIRGAQDAYPPMIWK